MFTEFWERLEPGLWVTMGVALLKSLLLAWSWCTVCTGQCGPLLSRFQWNYQPQFWVNYDKNHQILTMEKLPHCQTCKDLLVSNNIPVFSFSIIPEICFFPLSFLPFLISLLSVGVLFSRLSRSSPASAFVLFLLISDTPIPEMNKWCKRTTMLEERNDWWKWTPMLEEDEDKCLKKFKGGTEEPDSSIGAYL